MVFPSDLKKIQTVLAIETHTVVGQMYLLAILFCPTFEQGIGLRVLENDYV
jgi:hypothetical protein